MNCVEFYNAMCRQEYKNNPDRAQELYNYGYNKLFKEAIGGSTGDQTVEQLWSKACKYWTDMGLPLQEQHLNLIKWAHTSFLNKTLRVEFDEAYAESQFEWA